MQTAEVPQFINDFPRIDEVEESLRNHGICVIHQQVGHVDKLKQECRALLQSYRDDKKLRDYAFGELASVIMEDDETTSYLKDGYPALWEYFSQPRFKELVSRFDLPEERFFKHLYISHDYTNKNGLARNGYLHFDRNWTLKFMLYLSDVTEHSGPFSVIPGSHKAGNRMRTEGWQQHRQYQHVPNRIELDFPELALSQSNAVPIIGKAGTLIVFDTDIFHFGGCVENDSERLIARSHSFNTVASVEAFWRQS